MKRLVAKGKWKNVKFNNESDDEGRFDYLIDFQELTDYVIEDAPILKETKKRKAKQNDNGNNKKAKLEDEDTLTEISNDAGEISKKKQKKSNKNKSETEIEDINDDIIDEPVEIITSKKEKQKKKKQKKRKVKKAKATELAEEVNSNTEELQSTPIVEDEIIPELISSNDVKSEDMSDFRVEGMSGWNGLFVPPEILRALMEKNFDAPTAIQSRALPSAIRDRMDIIGAAETGSGKTLAFAIPIVTRLLEMAGEDVDEFDDDDADNDDNDADNDDDVEDEAMEVDQDDDVDEDDDKINDNNSGDDGDDEEEDKDDAEEIVDENKKQIDDVPRKYLKALIMTPTRELAMQIKEHIEAITKYTTIRCAVLVGGMAQEKQMRLLSKMPEIVIATPGRLWELIQQRQPHVSKMKGLKFLVIDEVDRMLERQHFEELDQILNHVHKKGPQKKQVFVFSATLTFVHTKPKRTTLKKNKKLKDFTVEEKLDSLKKKLNMSIKPKVLDLTEGQNMMAQKLIEKRINCSYEHKDIYLYYFLKSHPGRTIIFTNSKDCIRRLNSLMSVMRCTPFTLHADMCQAQRLKNMDRFKVNENGLLLATDVAARGLDIPDVQHVIHYQVPLTAESYVHRSGRTARSNKNGLSVVFISPQEEKSFHGIMTSLKRDKDLPALEVDRPKYSAAMQVVKLAQKIEKETYRTKKEKKHKNWVSKMAEEADMLFEDEEESGDDDDYMMKENHDKKVAFESLQMELNLLLGIQVKPKSKKNKKKPKKA